MKWGILSDEACDSPRMTVPAGTSRRQTLKVRKSRPCASVGTVAATSAERRPGRSGRESAASVRE